MLRVAHHYAALTLLVCMLCASAGSAQEPVARTGDIVSITVWERQALSGAFTVDAKGNIALPPPVGLASVSGLTSAQITDQITERLREYVVNPTVFVTISQAPGFVVHVLGEVLAPNFVQVVEGTTLQEAITRAGGPTPLADTKQIRVLRHGEAEAPEAPPLQLTVNLLAFSESGVASANPVLQAGDVIFVPRLPKSARTKAIRVVGAVRSPQIIPTEEPMPLLNVLTLAGGVENDARLSEIAILSFDDGNYSWQKTDFERFLAGDTEAISPDIEPGQVVFVPSELTDEMFTVNVAGQVMIPGAYSATTDSRLFDALYQAGGFAEGADIENVVLMRQGSDDTIRTSINVKQFLTTGHLQHNPRLQKSDTIFVPITKGTTRIPAIHTAFFRSVQVSIIGEVNRPNTYQVSTEANLLDILKLSGGPTSDADMERVTLIRGSTEAEQQRIEIDLEKVLTEGAFHLMSPLQANDTIFVPKVKTRRNIWGTVVSLARDISTIALAVLLITGQR